MTVYDVPCVHSFSACTHCAVPFCERDRLFLGQGASIFLNIHLPPVFGLQSLKRATLILFKIPGCQQSGSTKHSRSRYWAWPLLDYYNIYGCAYALPRVDPALKTPFVDDVGLCALEIDVTAIVEAWLNDAPENRGLLLSGPKDARRIVCASEGYEIPGMRPMLRLVSEDIVLCQPLSSQNCIVTI